MQTWFGKQHPCIMEINMKSCLSAGTTSDWLQSRATLMPMDGELCLFPSDPVTRQTLFQPTDQTKMCKRWCWWGLKPEAMNPKRIGDLMNNRSSKMHVQSHCIIRKISQIRVHVLLQYKARWVTSLRSMNFLIWSIWCNGKLWATDLKF
jgi:hypothetical protein